MPRSCRAPPPARIARRRAVAHRRAPRLTAFAAHGFQKRVAWPADPDSKQKFDGRVEQVFLQRMHDAALHGSSPSVSYFSAAQAALLAIPNGTALHPGTRKTGARAGEPTEAVPFQRPEPLTSTRS